MRQFCYGFISGLVFAFLPFSSFGSSNIKQEETQEKTLTSVITATPVALSPEYSLPHDVRVHILSFLAEQKDLLRIGSVSKGWRNAAEKVWEKRPLDLSNKHLTEADYKALARGIFPRLKLNYIDKKGVSILATCSQLQELELHRNSLRLMVPLIKLLSLTRLSHSDIYNNNISIKGAKAIAEALSQNRTLTTVDLRSNNIGGEGAKAITGALFQHITLISVYLRSNRIGDEGAKAITGALSQNTTLTTVDLYNNRIGDEGAQAIASALSQNRILTTLDLSSNTIGAEGAKAIAQMLSQNTTLTMIDLSSNRIGDAGRKALEDLKRRRPSLKLEY